MSIKLNEQKIVRVLKYADRAVVEFLLQGPLDTSGRHSENTSRDRRGRMESNGNIDERDLRTLAGIVRGPGFYATPSPDRVNRMVEKGLVTMKRPGTPRPTLKGRVIAWLYRKS